MELLALMPYLSLAAMLISVGTAINSFVRSGAKENAVVLADHEKRIQAAEQELRFLPAREDFHRLELSLERVGGRLEAMDEKLKPVAAISERMQEILLSQAKSR